MLSPSNPLKRPGYRFFTLIAVVAGMGGGFHFIASYWLLFTETSSSIDISKLVISYILPCIIILPFSGVIIDRLNRRKLIVAINFYLFLLNAILIYLLISNQFKPSFLYIYGALSGVIYAIFWSAFSAYLPQILSKDELLHANSLNTAIFHGGYLAGAGLAGVVYPYIGAAGAFGVDAASCLLGTFGWIYLKKWFPDTKQKVSNNIRSVKHFITDFIDGTKYTTRHWALFLFATLMITPRISAQLLNVVGVGFSQNVLHAGSVGFGLIDMSYGIGGMLCGILFPWFVKRFGIGIKFPMWSLVFSAIAATMNCFSTSVAFSMFCTLLMGSFVQAVGILANTTLQKETSNEVLGRVGSSVQLLQYIIIPLPVYALGVYASLPKGLFINQNTLRDSFFVIALFFIFMAFISQYISTIYSKRPKTPQINI